MSDVQDARDEMVRNHYREQLAEARAERDRLQEERDKALRAHAAALIESRIWERRTERAEAERDTLAAELACAGTVVEAAMAWRHSEILEDVRRLEDAVDAYQATPAGTETAAAREDHPNPPGTGHPRRRATPSIGDDQ